MDWSRLLNGKRNQKIGFRDKIIAIGLIASVGIALFLTAFVFDHYDCSTIVPDVAEVCRQLPWHGMNLENQALVFHVKPPSSKIHFESYVVTPRIYSADDQSKTPKVLPTTSKLEDLDNGWTKLPTFSTYLDAGRWQVALAIDTVVMQGNSTTHTVYNAEPSFFVEPVQDYHNFLIAIGTFAAFIGTATAVGIQVLFSRKQNAIAQAALDHERDSRWKDWYIRHSETLAHELSTNWTRTSGIFSFHVNSSGEFRTFAGREPSSPYSDEARDHLQSGYPDVWKLYSDSKSDAVQQTLRIDSSLEFYKSKIRTILQAECRLKERNSQDASAPFYYDVLFLRLLDEFRYRIFAGSAPSEFKMQLTKSGSREYYTVSIGHHLIAEIHDETEAKHFIDLLAQLLANQQVIEAAKNYLEYTESLAKSPFISNYSSRLSEIISDIEGGMPIETPRACRMCKSMHQYIFGDKG